ncbi:MAG: hypothetical protein EF813_07750 [Methanosarcinales archaeon]|nr:MAG: hypothetical protein EF813_07750 [Methanosarcinales archaeon]
MKAKTVLVAIAAMMMVAVMMLPAVAVPPATTQAEVTGAGSPPVFEEKFELNDDGDPTHVTDGTQVLPVPDGDKEVCVYVVARDPNGAADINRIWITVNNPNGVEVANGDTLNAGEITELTHAEACTATQAAVTQNLMISARKTVIDDHVAASEWRMWKFCFNMGNCYMSGDYNVTAYANDGSGGTGTIVNTFEYISIKELAIDFDTINYGTIVPGVKQIISGDTNFGTADAPTVRNRANDPFKLQISAADMQGTNANNRILATNLDAHVYGKDAPSGSAIDEELNLDYTPGILFSPIIDTCKTEKIDFSLLQGTICQDTYTGTITLEAVTP